MCGHVCGWVPLPAFGAALRGVLVVLATGTAATRVWAARVGALDPVAAVATPAPPMPMAASAATTATRRRGWRSF
ncbi:MAG TPA: hypothetical protein VGL44_12535 [Gaiellales bacterium]